MGLYEQEIQSASSKYGIPVEIIKAIIQVESSWNRNAYRAELKINDASWGLMQVLYRTAQWLGYSGPPEGLYDPATNINLGTKYLKYQWDRYGNWVDVFAAYNAGTAKRKTDGTYINQNYVDKVKTALQKIAKNTIGFSQSANGIVDAIIGQKKNHT